LVGLGFAFFADLLGLHFVVGVFFGTLLVAEHVISDRDAKEVRRATSAVTSGIFGPVFFAFIGLSFVGSSLGNSLLVFVVLGMAITTKFLGGYVGAWWAKFPLRERIGMGFGVNGRGAMELVIATIGLELGFIDAALFSILVLTGVVTTVMTPIGLRLVFYPPEVVSPIPSGDQGRVGGANGRA
jgi:Kef-type K+ transport system membrane component KefB